MTKRPLYRKTFKREAALLSLAAWVVISWKYFSLTVAEIITAFGAGYSAMTTSVFLFAAACFGVQVWQNKEAEQMDLSNRVVTEQQVVLDPNIPVDPTDIGGR